MERSSVDITHFPDTEFHSERRHSNTDRHFWGKMNNFYRGSRTREAKKKIFTKNTVVGERILVDTAG
jgi:hypothetical protein